MAILDRTKRVLFGSFHYPLRTATSAAAAGRRSSSSSAIHPPSLKDMSRELCSAFQTIHEGDNNNNKGGGTDRMASNSLSNADATRTAAIANLCEELDHWDQSKHDEELLAGMDEVLHSALSSVMMTKDNFKREHEIRMLCSGFEMLYRASPEAVSKSFGFIGSSIIALLLRTLEMYDGNVHKTSIGSSEVICINIVKILYYFSKIDIHRPDMNHQLGLVTCLLRFIEINPKYQHKVELSTLKLCTLANLSQHDDNKVNLMNHPTLVDTLVKSFRGPDQLKKFSIAILMNLSTDGENQEQMASRDKILNCLIAAIHYSDELIATHAVTTLQNLAYSKKNRKRMVEYGKGAILSALVQMLKGDELPNARRRAAGTLMNLSCNDTATFMGSCEGLLDVIAVTSSCDENASIRNRASSALCKLADEIQIMMPCFRQLLRALVKGCSSGVYVNPIVTILRIKARDPENRIFMAKWGGLVESLCNIAVRESVSFHAREGACKALMHLANADENRLIMIHTPVLDTLVKISSFDAGELRKARDSAVVALVRLAVNKSNRKSMANHEGIITVLARAVERDTNLLEHRLVEKSKQVHHEQQQTSNTTSIAKPALISLILELE